MSDEGSFRRRKGIHSPAALTQPRPTRYFRAPPAAAAAWGGDDCLRGRRGIAGWRLLLLRRRRWLLALQEPAQQEARGPLVEALVGIAAAGPG